MAVNPDLLRSLLTDMFDVMNRLVRFPVLCTLVLLAGCDSINVPEFWMPPV